MGLSVSHGAWNGAYSHFHQWRLWVADQIGFALDEYGQGFCGEKVCVPWALIEHPLVPLLKHPDHQGRIPWWQCREIAIALLHVIRNAHEPGLGIPSEWKTEENQQEMVRLTKRFATGAARAFDAREDLLFT